MSEISFTIVSPIPCPWDDLKVGKTYWGILHHSSKPRRFTIKARDEHGTIETEDGLRFPNFTFSYDVNGTKEPRIYSSPEEAVQSMIIYLNNWLKEENNE